MGSNGRRHRRGVNPHRRHAAPSEEWDGEPGQLRSVGISSRRSDGSWRQPGWQSIISINWLSVGFSTDFPDACRACSSGNAGHHPAPFLNSRLLVIGRLVQRHTVLMQARIDQLRRKAGADHRDRRDADCSDRDREGRKRRNWCRGRGALAVMTHR
jgi:hypothetical protein